MTYAPPEVRGIQQLANGINALDVLGTRSWTATASAAYPLANLAIYVPFTVDRPITFIEGWVVTGATGGGNFDIGIYSAAGARLTSAGATARAATDYNNTTTFTDYTCIPGVRYYMAFSADGTNNYIASPNAKTIFEACGVLESTTSYVLPTSPTLSRTTRAYVPLFGLRSYSVTF